MSVETHVALSEPVMMADQPGHSNLISYGQVDASWITNIEQGIAGPEVTKTGWLFNEGGAVQGLGFENDRAWATAEYQLGLSQAMNVGLVEYLDTQIAVNLYNHLAPAEMETIGTALLTEATRRNPYNPAPWYPLAQHPVSPVQMVALAKSAEEQMQMANGSDGPEPLKASRRTYWQMVKKGVMELGLINRPPVRDRGAARQVCDFLLTLPEITAEQKMPYLIRALEDGEGQVGSSAKEFAGETDAAIVGPRGSYPLGERRTGGDLGGQRQEVAGALQRWGMNLYDLPAKQGVLSGTNLLGWRPQITRKTALSSR